MRPLDLGAPVPSDFVEPRCISIATTAHLLGVRKRQVWEWIIEGSLRTVTRDERMVICQSIEDLIRNCANSAATLQEILARPGTNGE